MTETIALSSADRLVASLSAAVVHARTEGRPVVELPETWRSLALLHEPAPELSTLPLGPLDRAVFDVAVDNKEPALELRCGRCDSTICDVVASDGLRPIVRAALTHEEECLAGIRAKFVDDLANTIRSIDGSHQLGAGELAERLVDAGWTKP